MLFLLVFYFLLIDRLRPWPRDGRGDASADPQAVAVGMTASFEHPTAGTVGTTGLPWWFSDSTPVLGTPPLLGQHSSEMLRELGVSEDDAGRLMRARMVHQAALPSGGRPR